MGEFKTHIKFQVLTLQTHFESQVWVSVLLCVIAFFYIEVFKYIIIIYIHKYLMSHFDRFMDDL